MTMTTLPPWVPAEDGAQAHSSNLSLEEASELTVTCWCDGKTVSYQFFHLTKAIDQPRNLSRSQAMEYGAEAAETGTTKIFLASGLSTNAVRNFGRRLFQYGKNGK